MTDTSPTEPTPEATGPDPGVPEGTVLSTTTHDGEHVEEKVVLDVINGETVGWHKELV